MPVHSYTISNATGATIRADLNNALSAIVTNNSSNSEPATKYAYMWWADTSAGLLKIRNSDNNAWITLFQLDGTLTLEDGSNSAPAIGFRDDDNTGIFSSAADNLDITTGGTTRVNVSSAGINVTGTVTDDGASHDGDVTFIGASANINFDKSDNALEFADNAKAVFGNSDDLKIYHDSSDSYVQDSGTGKLVLATNGASVNIYDTANSAQLAKFITGGAVELYHSSTKRFETISTGVQVTENLGVGTSPSHLIHAKNSSVSSTKIVVESTGTNSYPALRIINDARSYDFGIDGATDNLRIYDVNGTAERLVVNSDGHIDIPGNLDVGAGIDVTGDITATGQITASGNGITISGSSASLTLTDDGDDPDYRVQNNNGQFRIFDFTNSANRFSINSSGIVDIAGRLDANGGLNVDGDLTISSTVPTITFTDTDNNPDFTIKNDNGNLRFRDETNSSTRLKINSDGHVDVTGNLDVGAGIDVTGDITTSGSITINGNELAISGADPVITFTDNENNPDFQIYSNSGSMKIYDSTNSVTRLQINSDGHVDVTGNLDVGSGIDVTGNITATGDIRVPDDKSIFLGGSDDFKFMHRSSDNISVIKESGGSDLSIETNGSKAQFYDSVNGRNMAEFNVGGACSFKHGATTRLETLSDGVNVTGTLKINGSAISTGGLGNVVEDTTPQLGGDLQSNGNDIDFADGDKAIFGTDGDLLIYHQDNNSHILDNGTGDLRVTTNGAKIDFQKSGGEVLARFITDGAVQLYEDNVKRFETTDFGVTVQGGITFGSDTAAANQLDDYEEGTWTPTLTFGGATTNITYTSLRFGNYTKIGRQVTVNFAFKLQNKGTTTGDAMVAGLPFAVEDLFSDTTVEANGVSSYWNNVATDSANIVFAAVGGQSQINVRHTVGAQEVTEDMQDNDFANNTTLRGSITYFTAT